MELTEEKIREIVREEIAKYMHKENSKQILFRLKPKKAIKNSKPEKFKQEGQ